MKDTAVKELYTAIASVRDSLLQKRDVLIAEAMAPNGRWRKDARSIEKRAEAVWLKVLTDQITVALVKGLRGQNPLLPVETQAALVVAAYGKWGTMGDLLGWVEGTGNEAAARAAFWKEYSAAYPPDSAFKP